MTRIGRAIAVKSSLAKGMPKLSARLHRPIAAAIRGVQDFRAIANAIWKYDGAQRVEFRARAR